jgi:putative transposase
MPATSIRFCSLNGLLEGLDQDDREGDALLSAARENLKMLVEETLELDRTAQLGRARHERKAGAGYRNGYYERDLETGFGVLRQLRVPRLRHGGLEQGLFERYQRRRRDVERFVRALFFAGVSTRAVGEVLEILWGIAPSATSVSRIVAAIDKEVAAYHQRPLGDDFVYLFLDALTVTLKEAPNAVKRLVLVAYGITSDGRRVLLDFRVAPSESAEEWERFLLGLRRRGLVGANLRLIITDGGKGLRRAAADAYPDTPCQLCWAHKLRNVAGYLHRANVQACLAQARCIYQAPNRREALRAWKEWQDAWQDREPRAVECLARDLEALLTFLLCPPEHRKIVRTTNYIERMIRQLRRRTRPMGAFADKTSCERLFYGVIRRLNIRWSDRKPMPGFTQNS